MLSIERWNNNADSFSDHFYQFKLDFPDINPFNLTLQKKWEP